MRLSRRKVLQLTALFGGGAVLAGCDGAISEASRRLGLTIPDRLIPPDGKEIDSNFHLLSRAGYGPWPGDLERVEAMGVSAWLDEQLNPERIDDGLCELRARRFETIYLSPGDCYEFKNNVLRDDLTRYTLLRAIYSKRQLLEVMVAFWTDHLNINLEKGDCIYLKAGDDRRVVRAHALGNFKELIKSSCLSPAMLVYLDGKENKRARPTDVPNENYARELLELHTLGVDGGYRQKDVYEAARCLTGWKLHQKGEFAKGSVYFDSASHDDGEKVVLGKTIARGGGQKDVDRLIDIVADHPSTARYIATKLVRYFVSDDPPAALVDTVAEKFRSTRGDLKLVIRTILTSEQFQQHKGEKFKRPFRYMVSALRGIGADTHAKNGLVEYLSRMGHGPFQYPTPDGYPEEMMPWLGTLLWRWNFALALACNDLPSVGVSADKLASALLPDGKSDLDTDLLIRHFVGRKATEAELQALNSIKKGNSDLLGLVLACPAFQRF